MKNSNDTIRNRTHDFPAYSAMTQPNAPPCKIIEVFLLLGCYAAHVGNGLPTFREGTSVNHYQHTLRNNPEERRPHPHRGGSLRNLLNNCSSP